MSFTFLKTAIDTVWVIEPSVYGDHRGHFLEAFREEIFREKGLISRFVQDNISTSKKGTVRGLHYQKEPHAQAKLVMAITGTILDVAVDLRKHSPTFGQYVSVELSDQNRRMILVPPGFAHGFSVLSEAATVLYKCSGYYHRDSERGVKWNDPALNINWHAENPTISDKDKKQPLLQQVDESDLF